MEIETQTELLKTANIGTQTDKTPSGAVIIQKAEKAKKKSSMKKRQIKDVPNAIPSEAQRFRIFKEIDYPYMMRDVQVQNDEDKMVKALREVFGIKEKTPEMVAEEALEKSYYKGKSYPLYTDEELTQQERRIKAINSDNKLKKLVGVRGLFDDIDVGAEASLIPPELRKASEDYSRYLRTFDSKYLEGSTPLSEIPYPKLDVEALEDKVASYGSLPRQEKKKEYSGRGRRPKQINTLDIKLPKQNPIEKALEEYEAVESAISGVPLTEAQRQKQREKIAINTIGRWAKVGLAKEKLFNKMMERSIQQEAFNYNLEKMKKEREQQDKEMKQRKEIERSFGLYESSRRARKEGEMASLLFDVD